MEVEDISVEDIWENKQAKKPPQVFNNKTVITTASLSR